MNLKDLEVLVNEAVKDSDLRPEEIPSIDLYLDQITSLVSEKLKESSPRFQDRVLTKTMVNNYSKDGLISPIQGKKYSKEQIIQMMLVYSLKNTLSIGEIKRMLQNIYALPQTQDGMLEEVYLRFLEIKEFEREEAWNLLLAFINGSALDLENEADFFTLILGLSSMSSYLKNIVQALLESHYPDIDAENLQKEQERREEWKRQREELKAEVRAKKAEVREVKKEGKKKEKQASATDLFADDAIPSLSKKVTPNET